MATYVTTVAGVTKTIQPGWTISETANGRNRLDCDILSLAGTYRPALDDEFLFTEDGILIFGGLIDRPVEAGFGGVAATAAIQIRISAADFNVYASRARLTADIPAGTFKAALTVVAAALSAYGVTLDAAQVTGPAVPAVSYHDKPIIDVLNELSSLAGGYLWEITYGKVLHGWASGSLAAPFTVTDGDGHVDGDITVEQPRTADYGNYVVLLAGTGQRDVVDSFTGNGVLTTFALHYTLASTYGYVNVGGTVSGGVISGGVNETLGPGATWTYNPVTNSITRTSAPGAVAINMPFTAQFPLRFVADGGLPAANRVVKTYTAEDVFDRTVAQALADAYLARDIQSPKTVRYRAAFSLTGIHPGQVQTITSTKRNLSGSFLITDVRIANVAGVLAQREVTAVSTTQLPQTLREKFQQTFGGTGSSASAAAGTVTVVSSGGVGGGGTIGKLAKWATVSTLGDSLVSESGTVASIAGSLVLTGGITAGSGSVGLVDATGKIPAIASTYFASLSGANLTSVPAGQLTGTITSSVQDNITRLGTIVAGTVPWARLTFSGSSLADLATRSATDLSSGNLAYARMPTGSGTWTATPTISGTLTVSTIASPAATNLTLSPTTSLVTNTSNVLPNSGYVTNIGALSNKYLTLHAAELWVETLVAQKTLATIGGRILVAPTNILTADLASGATTMSVKYNNFANGDYAVMEANGSLEWIKITSAPSGSGPYTYTITRDLDGSGSDNWVAGDALVNTGTTGSGYIDLYSVAGVLPGSTAGPTIVGTVRTGTATYANLAARWAIGNLTGLYGYGATYGAAFGDPSGSNITIDATNGVRIRSTATVYAQMAAGVFTLGLTSGNRVAWDGTNLTVVSANLLIDSTGIAQTPNTTSAWAGDRSYKWTVPTGKLGISGWDVAGAGVERSVYIISEWSGSGDKTPSITLYAHQIPSGGGVDNAAQVSLFATNATAEIQMSAAGGIYLGVSGGDTIVSHNLSVLGTSAFTGAASLTGGLVLPTDQLLTLAAGNTNDQTLNAGVSILLVTSNAAGSTLTGLTGGVSGRVIIISNIGNANPLTLANENVNSTATNRFGLGSGGTVVAGDSVMVVYYNNRWRVIR